MPVAFASKTLTSAEHNYANIKHELLGVVFGVLHFKHFTFDGPQAFSIPAKEVISCM